VSYYVTAGLISLSKREATMRANEYLHFDTFIAKRSKRAFEKGCDSEQRELLAEVLRRKHPLPNFYSEYAFYSYVWELVRGRLDCDRLYGAMELWKEYQLYPRRPRMSDTTVLSLRQFITEYDAEKEDEERDEVDRDFCPVEELKELVDLLQSELDSDKEWNPSCEDLVGFAWVCELEGYDLIQAAIDLGNQYSAACSKKRPMSRSRQIATRNCLH